MVAIWQFQSDRCPLTLTQTFLVPADINPCLSIWQPSLGKSTASVDGACLPSIYGHFQALWWVKKLLLKISPAAPRPDSLGNIPARAMPVSDLTDSLPSACIVLHSNFHMALGASQSSLSRDFFNHPSCACRATLPCNQLGMVFVLSLVATLRQSLLPIWTGMHSAADEVSAGLWDSAKLWELWLSQHFEEQKSRNHWVSGTLSNIALDLQVSAWQCDAKACWNSPANPARSGCQSSLSTKVTADLPITTTPPFIVVTRWAHRLPAIGRIIFAGSESLNLLCWLEMERCSDCKGVLLWTRSVSAFKVPSRKPRVARISCWISSISITMSCCAFVLPPPWIEKADNFSKNMVQWIIREVFFWPSGVPPPDNEWFKAGSRERPKWPCLTSLVISFKCLGQPSLR